MCETKGGKVFPAKPVGAVSWGEVGKGAMKQLLVRGVEDYLDNVGDGGGRNGGLQWVVGGTWLMFLVFFCLNKSWHLMCQGGKK
jgi:hypothetical protein